MISSAKVEESGISPLPKSIQTRKLKAKRIYQDINWGNENSSEIIVKKSTTPYPKWKNASTPTQTRTLKLTVIQIRLLEWKCFSISCVLFLFLLFNVLLQVFKFCSAIRSSAWLEQLNKAMSNSPKFGNGWLLPSHSIYLRIRNLDQLLYSDSTRQRWILR